jgi:GxxExxY protein
MADLIYKDESFKIMGACFEVYNELGCGFLEPVYQECLEIEMAMQEMPFRAQEQLKLRYKDHLLTQVYEPDFICWEKVIVEIKAVSELAHIHRAQLQNYLKATGHRLGLLVNFGNYPKLEWERIVR